MGLKKQGSKRYAKRSCLNNNSQVQGFSLPQPRAVGGRINFNGEDSKSLKQRGEKQGHNWGGIGGKRQKMKPIALAIRKGGGGDMRILRLKTGNAGCVVNGGGGLRAVKRIKVSHAKNRIVAREKVGSRKKEKNWTGPDSHNARKGSETMEERSC